MSSQEIVRLLRKYSKGRLPKEEVIKRAEKYDALDIWQAKLRLMMNEDFSEEDLTRVNTLITEIKDKRSMKILEKLGQDHPIASFLADHSAFNKKLNRLEKMSDDLEENKRVDENRLIELVRGLKKVNEHDRREEDLLFSQLRSKDMREMVKLLEIRHSRMENRIEKLNELVDDFEDNKEKIVESIKKTSYSVRDHFFKENDILYPTSLKLIDDWQYD